MNQPKTTNLLSYLNLDAKYGTNKNKMLTSKSFTHRRQKVYLTICIFIISSKLHMPAMMYKNKTRNILSNICERSRASLEEVKRELIVGFNFIIHSVV